MENGFPIGYCAWCGAEFQITKPTKRFCSSICQRAHNNAKKTKSAPKPKACAWCGKEFIPQNASAKYCSSKCRTARGHAAAKARCGAEIFATHRDVKPSRKPKPRGPFCPNPRCSWLKYEGYGKGFCVRPVCIYSQRAGKK